MSETRHTTKNTVAYLQKYANKVRTGILFAYKKIKSGEALTVAKSATQKINAHAIRATYKKTLSKAKSLVRKYYKACKRFFRKLSSSWKMLLICVPTFLFCYYGIGSFVTENTDTAIEYQLREKHIPTFETAQGMSFLIKREVDDKMWTPNLPFVFPAYVLDNMPNFQTGVIGAVKDITSVLRKFDQNTDAQKKEIKKAYQYLLYSPKVWLMTRKGKFNLAPSSNAQYRKAAAELYQFGKDGVYYPKAADLDALLRKINIGLLNLASRNESQQSEHSTDWVDIKSDDLFYYNRGYAYAMWQISKVMGADYREIILKHNMYTEWTYLVGSLKKAAALKPTVVRNGTAESMWTPNHLIMQNYYLLRAITAAEKIRNKLSEESRKEDNADKN